MAVKKKAKKSSNRKTSIKQKSAQTKINKISPKGTSKEMAILGLILNILILPGLGTLIGGKTKDGTWQLVMSIVAFVLALTVIGIIIAIPLGIAAWIWGLISGIKMIQESQ